MGFSTKGTDGVFGNNTEKAVIAFQKAYGLTADGIVGAETQKVIANAIESKKKEILKVGRRGSKVTELQKNLTKLGYDTKGTDGIFGNDTKKAVIKFQKAYGLTADGIAGTKKLVAIEKELNTNRAN